MNNNIQLIDKVFNDNQIRTVWDADEEKFYISVVDVVGVLTESDNPRKYWSVLKIRLINEGNQTATNCSRLKLKASDGKYRLTDVVDIEGMFRIIESIPSKKAEPIKLWLAQLGKERIDEEYDPEITINRALETYKKKGYSDEWINQRLKSIDVRHEFTDELKNKGINSAKDFAILTNILTKQWSGYSDKEYKQLKDLKKENLRDNMTNVELIFNTLAEITSTEISKCTSDTGYDKVESSIIKGGNIAKNAREQLEMETGKKVVSSSNNKNIKYISNE